MDYINDDNGDSFRTEESNEIEIQNYKEDSYIDNFQMNLPVSRDLSDTPVGQRPTLRQGDTGPWVEELQRELTQLTFYNGPIDGVFGTATLNAVKAFQTNNKLTADGVVGRNTWSALIFLYSPLATCPGSGLLPTPFKGVVIDAGHGGTDPGASGNGIVEKEINLMISKYMNDRFYELNIPHAMTRITDETLSNTERVNRVKNAFGSDPGVILISNHNNAGGGEGAEVIYALRNTSTYPTMILNEIKLAGQVTRRVFQRPLDTNPNQDYYFILRDTSPIQAVIVEYAFLDNAVDAERLRFNWMRYAEAVVKATCDYIGYPYRPPYSEEIIYTVVAGDTLFSIAQKFQTTVEAIMQLNNLTSTLITVGQRLKIPFFGSTTPPPEETFVYTVVAGDNLWAIAQRFGTTMEEIMRLNNLTSTLIFPGQQLLIPGTEPTPPPPPPPPTRPTLRLGDRGEYVSELQRILTSLGYNPGSIDGIFGQGTQNAVIAFQRANGLSPDGIVGSATWTALINAETPSYFMYTVVAGDNLWAIAKRYGTTMEEIMRLNNLTSTLIFPGQQLKIPNTGTTPPQYTTYTVVAGDNLWAIAQRYGTTMEEIMRLNNLTSTLIFPGQQLKIPIRN